MKSTANTKVGSTCARKTEYQVQQYTGFCQKFHQFRLSQDIQPIFYTLTKRQQQRALRYILHTIHIHIHTASGESQLGMFSYVYRHLYSMLRSVLSMWLRCQKSRVHIFRQNVQTTPPPAEYRRNSLWSFLKSDKLNWSQPVNCSANCLYEKVSDFLKNTDQLLFSTF